MEKCDRTACNNPHDNCKHTDYLGRLYCHSCASKINNFHRDTHPQGLITIPAELWLNKLYTLAEKLEKK